MRFIPNLAPDVCGPPDPRRGVEALNAWLCSKRRGLKIREFVSAAEIRVALSTQPNLVERLRQNPGPYAQAVAEQDATDCMAAVDALFQT